MINKSVIKIFVSSLLFSLFFTFGFIFAAQVQAQSFGETLDVSITPANPTAGTHVFLTVKDVAANLDRTQITWTLDGKVMKKGIGEKNFDFILGGLGTVSSVTVTTDVLSKNIKIRPTDIDLVWESDGYTPPFYKGKSLRAFQGNVRFVATPHFFTTSGTELDPNKLIYNWRNGGVLNPSASGYGKNSLTYPGSTISRPLTIEVTAASVDGTYKGVKEITVEETEPMTLLYEDHPLYGILYNNSLNGKDFALKDAELKVTAIPYFFSAKDKSDGKLKYSWSINGNFANNPGAKDSVVLRKDANTSGVSNISLSLENQTEFIQLSNASFRINFGNSSTGQN